MKNIPKLLVYLKGYERHIALYVIVSLLAVLFSLFSFSMLAPVLQVLFVGQETTNASGIVGAVTEYVNTLILKYDKLTALGYAIVTVVVFTILKNVFTYWSLLILNPLRYSVIRKLRNDLFSKTLSLPIGFFTEERKGDLVSRMTNDVNEVEISIMSVVETLIREPFTIVFVLTSMVLISPQLTLFLLLFLPVAGLIIGRIGRSLKKPSNLAQEKLGEMLSVLDESIGGMRVVKAFNAEKNQFLRFLTINNELFRARVKVAARRDAGSPISETLGILVVCVILWYGGYLIFKGDSSFTGPWFMAFIGLFYQIINPLKNLSSSFYNMQKGAAAMDRIQALLDADNMIVDALHPVSIKDFKDSITFKNVSFAYGGKQVLHNLNLQIRKGQTIALVGASGAGKSTFSDLIPRFHDVTGGELLIDGINIKDYKIKELRNLIGVVSQDPILFNESIRDNITLGTGGASEEQVLKAAQMANAYNFILKKPEGLDTIVGDRGSRLSGGERQRVTIARALLKDPPLLILDEATSSLDTESERLVQDAINNLMKNRTCIVIAHRLSTIQHADEIIVLDKGAIAERGTHQQLIGQNGIYTRLVAMQQMNA